MKRISLVLLAIAIASLSLMACAETAEINVYMTIVLPDGDLKLACAEVAVTDADGDGAFTINDALYCAHAQYCEEGTEAYGSASTEYGLSLTKLWGIENGGAYGYYVNNSSAMSLADTVNDGDFVNAFVYTDTTAYSDIYCYFDTAFIDAAAGAECTLTLISAGWDANWNAVEIPVEGAVITVDGEATEYTTDAEGKVTITVPAAGAVISATSETAILVSPVAIIK